MTSIKAYKDVDQLVSDLSEFLAKTKFNKTELVGEDGSVMADKVLLSARSSVLAKKVFKPSGDRIVLKEWRKMELEYFVQYCEKGELKFAHESKDLFKLFKLAGSLKAHPLKEWCAKQMEASVNPTNALFYLDVSSKFSSETLQKKCMEVIGKNVENSLNEEYFDECNKDSLMMVLGHDHLIVRDELFLFTRVQHYIELHPKIDKDELFELVRLGHIATGDLNRVVRRSGLIPEARIMDVLFGLVDKRFQEESKEFTKRRPIAAIAIRNVPNTHTMTVNDDTGDVTFSVVTQNNQAKFVTQPLIGTEKWTLSCSEDQHCYQNSNHRQGYRRNLHFYETAYGSGLPTHIMVQLLSLNKNGSQISESECVPLMNPMQGATSVTLEFRKEKDSGSILFNGNVESTFKGKHFGLKFSGLHGNNWLKIARC
eukprot:TRINITY_DN782118_c0_g1_i1.p1 TRINITY_DN782118_c0_g1~~TRINITY_DN782118_c0_g1_i1.p1  ORF type:complete len:426 (+),score=113.34 TRINITY_DN782118_c0_g1_i1:25-1302(+)